MFPGAVHMSARYGSHMVDQEAVRSTPSEWILANVDLGLGSGLIAAYDTLCRAQGLPVSDDEADPGTEQHAAVWRTVHAVTFALITSLGQDEATSDLTIAEFAEAMKHSDFAAAFAEAIKHR